MEAINKINVERNPKDFWKEVGRMMGRSRFKWAETYKNENGVELKTSEEGGEGFQEQTQKNV